MHGQVGRRVGHRDVQIAVLRIERERRPHCPAAHRDSLGVLPRLESWLSLLRHGVEPPDLRPVGHAEGADPSLKVVLAAGRPDQHEILEDHRRHAEGLALGRLRHLPRPQLRTGFRVQREQVAVRRAANHTPVLDADPAIALEPEIIARLPAVAPFDAARRRIERDGADHRRHVHRAVVDDRPGLKIVALADLEHARRRQARRRRRVTSGAARSGCRRSRACETASRSIATRRSAWPDPVRSWPARHPGRRR